MAHITTTDRPVFFATNSGGNIIHTGMIDTGGACGTPLAVDSDPDEITFLGKVAGKAGTYQPLPAAGTWLEGGQIYGYGGGLVIVRQSHTRTEHAPADVPALFSVYRAGGGTLDWIANEPVIVGTVRAYGGKVYRCTQAHVTQADWTPPNVPALWQEYDPHPQPGAWAYPVAYKIGDLVTYQGATYRCIQAHTSQAGWTPPAVPALWQVVP